MKWSYLTVLSAVSSANIQVFKSSLQSVKIGELHSTYKKGLLEVTSEMSNETV